MAKQVFLVADNSIGVVGNFLPQSMFDDLLALSRVPVEQLRDLATQLDREPGFLTPSRLEEVVRQIIPAVPTARAVQNTLNGIRPSHVAGVVQDLRAFREMSPRNGEMLSAETVAAIEARLGALVRDYPSLERYRKAEGLSEATGCEFLGVSLICDLRPVFDESRKVVEAVLPHTVLRLDYRGLNDSRQAVEVRLSESQLAMLIAEAEKAKRKLETLRLLADGRLPGEWLTLE